MGQAQSKKKVVTKFNCRNCKARFQKSYKWELSEAACPKCGSLVRLLRSVSDFGNISVRLTTEVVAYGHDTKTGQPMWLDKKGKRVRADNPGIRYDPIHDAHGWKATGQKVRPLDDRGRPNI